MRSLSVPAAHAMHAPALYLHSSLYLQSNADLSGTLPAMSLGVADLSGTKVCYAGAQVFGKRCDTSSPSVQCALAATGQTSQVLYLTMF